MLTQTAKYALQALIYLSQQVEDDYHQTREIAKRICVPSNYLGKTLQKLARARIVDSQKGLHGGFRSALLPEQVRLYDVLSAIDAVPKEADIDADSTNELDGLRKRLDGIHQLYHKFLKETTLEDVMKPDSDEMPQQWDQADPQRPSDRPYAVLHA